MLWAYTKWFPELILPHLYQKAAGWAEQQQPIAVRDPETGQNPAPCSAQLPRTSMPSLQPMGHNADPQNAQSSLSPTHTHTPSGILCPWKNTADAASPQGTFDSHKPTASCRLQYKRGLMLSLSEHSRSHGKLCLSGKTQGQTTTAHTRWGDTMHSWTQE